MSFNNYQFSHLDKIYIKDKKNHILTNNSLDFI